MYLTYGFLLGLGLSLIYSPSLTIVGHYFRRRWRYYVVIKAPLFFSHVVNLPGRFGLINGLVTCGSAVFTLIMYFLLDFLINQIGVSALLTSHLKLRL